MVSILAKIFEFDWNATHFIRCDVLTYEHNASAPRHLKTCLLLVLKSSLSKYRVESTIYKIWTHHARTVGWRDTQRQLQKRRKKYFSKFLFFFFQKSAIFFSQLNSNVNCFIQVTNAQNGLISCDCPSKRFKKGKR